MAVGRLLKAESVLGIGNRKAAARDDNAWSMIPCDAVDVSSEEIKEDKVSQGQRDEVSFSKKDAISTIRRRAALAQVDEAMV